MDGKRNRFETLLHMQRAGGVQRPSIKLKYSNAAIRDGVMKSKEKK